MSDKFIEIINYLDEINNKIDNEEISNEERIIYMIKYAVVRDPFFRGSIIFSKVGNQYKVSSIQKYSYAWLFKDLFIDVNYLINRLNELGIDNKLEHYIISDHNNDYELSFELNKIKKRTRKK